jgi:hypothetical protein
VGLGVFLILNFLLGGEFWNHLVVYNRNTMDWGAFRSVLKNEIWFFYRWWIIALAAGGILIGMGAIPPFRMASNDIVDERRRQGHRAAGIFATLYFVISAFSLAAFAKSGSAANYALEPLAAAAILVVTLIGGLQDGSAVSKPMGYRWISAAGLLVVSLCLTIHVARILPIMWTEVLPPGEAGEKVGRFLDERRVDWALFSSANPTPEEVARGDRVVAEIRETPGEVLSELPVFAMAAGCEVVFQPFIMTTLAREGRWQEAPFLEGLRRGRFGLIVTTQDLREVRRGGVLARYTDSMAEAILGRYALVEVSPPGPLGLPYFLWRPRPESAE